MAFVISILCFVLTIPLKVIIVFLQANRIALIGIDKQIEASDAKEQSKSDESQLKDKLSNGNSKSKSMGMKPAIIALTLLITLLKMLVNLIRFVAIVFQIFSLFALLIMFIVIVALLAAVGGCIAVVMGDGISGIGGTVSVGGGNQSTSTGGNSGFTGSNANWVEAMSTVANWYVANFDTYQHYIKPEKACDLPNVGTVRDDCSGYVSAIGKYMGWGWTTQGSSWFTNPNNETLLQHFTPVDLTGGSDNWNPRAGDILAYNGHVEMLVSYDESTGACVHWGWGSVKDKYPGGTYGSKEEMRRYHYSGKDHPFSIVWQYKGD